MEFDNDRALLLIELYRRHRVLWDPKHPLYYSKSRKAQAWAEVSSRVGGNVLDIRRKMESLLGSFRRERSRARRGCLGPKGKYEPYHSTWFAYDQMRFLIGRDNPKKPRKFALRPAHPQPEQSVRERSPEVEVDVEGLEPQTPYGDVMHSTFGEGLLQEAQSLETQASAELAEPEESELPTEPKPSAMVLPRKSTRRITRLAAREDLRTIAGKSWRQLRISARSQTHSAEDKSFRVTGWRKRRGGGRLRLRLASAPPLPQLLETSEQPQNMGASPQEHITRITSSIGPKLEPPSSPPSLHRDVTNSSPRHGQWEPQDVSGAFGTYVASKLRAYSSRTRSIVEHLVSNILFEADMGKFSKLQATQIPTSARVPLSDAGSRRRMSEDPVLNNQSPPGGSPLIVNFHEPPTMVANVMGENEVGEMAIHVEGAVKAEPLQIFESVDEFSIDE